MIHAGDAKGLNYSVAVGVPERLLNHPMGLTKNAKVQAAFLTGLPIRFLGIRGPPYKTRLRRVRQGSLSESVEPDPRGR